MIFALIAVIAALMTPARAMKKNIDSDELVKLQSQGAAVIDVRTAGEFSAGHIPGAVNVPIDQLPTASQNWSKTGPIVVYCSTGARSANASSYLAAQGFKKVYDLSQGIVAWTGQTEGGASAGSASLGDVKVETSGKPVFIDFAGST